MASNTHSTQEIDDKRNLVKQNSATLAKTLIALDLELINFQNNDRISQLKNKAICEYELLELNITDISQYFDEKEQSEITKSFSCHKQRLDGILHKIREHSSDCASQKSHSSSHKSRHSLHLERAQLKLEHLKSKQNLERKRQELCAQQNEVQRQLEILCLENEIAQSEMDDGSSSGEYGTVDYFPNNVESSQQKVKAYLDGLPSQPLRAEAKPFVGRNDTEYACRVKDRSPTPKSDGELQNIFRTFTNTIQENLSLPKPELLNFSGNPVDYTKFIHNFDTNIESRVQDDRLRLSYLIQYCQGDARKSIEDCVVLPPVDGYVRAKEILASRYGKPHLIARSIVDKLVNGPPVKSNDVEGLMNLSLDMEKCQITLSQIGFNSDISNSENLKKIVRRLPLHVRSKWVEKASSIIEQGFEPNFNDLLAFVRKRATVANTMYGIDLADATKASQISKQKLKSDTNRREKFVTLSTLSGENTTNSEIPVARADAAKKVSTLSCVHCKEPHKLIDCNKFKLMELSQKFAIVRRHKMCENCLNFKHFAKTCRKGSCCDIPGCNEKHNTLLHGKISLAADNAGQSHCCATLDKTTGKVCLRIVPVTVYNGIRNVDTYALLDEGSDITLCSDSLVKRLGAKGKQREFTLTTVNQSTEKRHGLELKLQVGALRCNDTIELDRVWSVERLPISIKSLPERREVSMWNHLKDIYLPRISEGQVELLIGSDTPDAFWVQEERRGSSGEPYAIRSVLGWSILGPIGKVSDCSAHVNVNFQQTTGTLEEIDRLWKTDFPECRSDDIIGMSQEDRRALSIMENTITIDNGHYKLGLPWRDENVSLPNDKVMATSRLSFLKRKLEKDEGLHSLYRKTMIDYIDKGYASPVDTKSDKPGKVWYLPHHPVINPNKPGKVRIVFDCAAKYQGKSLNDNILQGPDFMNSIIGVLIRFRQERIALIADIESMFHQVKVCENDRDALRFLWWPNGDITQQALEYRMNVHLFGATSSPSCAAYSLRRTAADNAEMYSKDVITSIERNFYVDDLLKSVSDVNTGIRISTELRDILSRGGFRLTKWLSNNTEVMKTIPDSEKSDVSKKVSIENDALLERALGLQWCVETDQFVFDVSLQEKSHTRRGILSVASSLYDPLGLVAPVTLIPKLVLQNACRYKLRWDEVIAENDASTWTHWLQSLPELSKVCIDRCLKPCELDMSTSVVELHMFSDASEHAYGSAVYSKIYDVNGNTKCSLVIGKSRLAPIKAMSIPRLELAAAVLSVKLYKLATRELEFEIHKRYFWTDSMIVLGYINNEKKRFKTFVANRLAIIHDATSKEDWRYVPTKLNPADLASRGLHPYETNKLETWLNGPTFLQKNDSQWPEVVSVDVQNYDDVEEKSVHNTQGKQGKSFEVGLEALISMYSDWNKLQRTVAWLLRFKAIFIQKYGRGKNSSQPVVNRRYLTVSEVRKATEVVLMMTQRDAFARDIKCILDTGRVLKVSSLNKLSPVYKGNLLRVGGRLENAEISYDSKHPVILPSDHHITRIIIRKYHEMNAHVGPHHVLSLIRQKYWVIHGLKTVKSVISKCIDCKKRQPRPEIQQMGQLPAERLTPGKPPFTFVGVDFYGPMLVKSGRKHLKRYGCLFTCMTTRAVHIEITHSLDTDSFICALQRFISRRGCPDSIYSDNGSNLKAGERELRDSLHEWNQSRISRHLNQREIEWHFNPPYASHMGGVWERLVRSVKTALKSVIKEQLLTDEALLTLSTEVEKILNDRPITQVSDDPRDSKALTPNMLLILRANSCIPPGVFDKSDNYCRRWWRQVQYLANVFWKRWTREYVPCLQVRQKWENIHRNLSVNDLVLVCDETSSRGHWPLGRILEVKSGRDGLVRSCRVMVNGTEKVRPISKLCSLEQHVN